MSENNTERVTPAQEHFVGTVLPGGRGTEQHGVPFDGAPMFVDEAEMGDPVKVREAPAPEPNPVPVRIVGEASRERRQFRTYRHPATKTPSQVVGLNENRTTVKVVNVGPEVVHIGSEAHTATAYDGFPLAVGASFETTAETPIYAAVDAAAATETSGLAVFHEFATGTH